MAQYVNICTKVTYVDKGLKWEENQNLYCPAVILYINILIGSVFNFYQYKNDKLL